MNASKMNQEMPQEQLQEAEAATFTELATLTEGRAKTYGLLARLFREEVDAGLLAELRQMRFPASTGNGKMDAGYRDIVTFLSNTWENSVEECAVDYVRTFLGNGVDTHAAAYPYESVYVSEKRLLMQDARDEILAIYRSVGLSRSEGCTESEDHVALELELLQILCHRTVEALSRGDEDAAVVLLETQRNFLEDHVASWVPAFAHDMRRFARTGLYRGLADVAEGFLEVEGELLADLLVGNECDDDAVDAAGAGDAEAAVPALGVNEAGDAGDAGEKEA